jgi:hypothetical protein
VVGVAALVAAQFKRTFVQEFAKAALRALAERGRLAPWARFQFGLQGRMANLCSGSVLMPESLTAYG